MNGERAFVEERGYMPKFADYLRYDALGLGELVRQREVSDVTLSTPRSAR